MEEKKLDDNNFIKKLNELSVFILLQLQVVPDKLQNKNLIKNIN